MNKKLIAMAVGAALLTPVLAQADGPKVYGQLHLSYGTIKEKSAGVTTKDNWQVRSHDSRLGFKGERDFGNGLMGTYKIELGVNPDTDFGAGGADNTAGIVRRNMYAGLKGGWGEVRFGRHDTPLKMAQGKFDQFGDTDGDLKHAGSMDGEHRLDNILAYLGKSGNIGYAIAFAPGEQAGTTAAGDDNNGPADTYSASISYSEGPLYVAVAHDSYANKNTPSAQEDALTRVVGTYKMGNMQLGLLYQSGVEKLAPSTDKEDWLGVSFGMGFGGSNKFKAQYITSKDKAVVKTETTLTAIGVDHKFDKKTTGYVQYVTNEAKTGATKDEGTYMVVGMNLKF